MQVVDLKLRSGPTRTCRIHVGRGATGALIEALVEAGQSRRIVLVSDDTVAPLHAEPLRERLSARGLSAEMLTFPAGEASKTRETKARLEDGLYELEVGRDCLLVAVGGGVTGDLAGFVASTWHRGVPVVQAPTSLLAMVDAAVGGKTGVNVSDGKNLIGSIHQPLSVWADVDKLSTLPQAELEQGFAEVIKSATIADADFFDWLEASVGSLLAREGEALEHAVHRSVEIKSAVVAGDEREAGRRAILNFGHTVGHALEAASGYRVSHGEAVAVGMCVEARIAVEQTGFSSEDVARLDALVEAFGLPNRPPCDVELDSVVSSTLRDKKVRCGRVHYVLPARIGRMMSADRPTREIDEVGLRRAWEAAGGRAGPVAG